MPEPRPIAPSQAKTSFAAGLRPVADRLRQLSSELGASPYRVFLVHTAWTGGDRGRGIERVVKTVEILPTPRVRAIDAVTRRPTAIGILEAADIMVDRVSAIRFDEDTLRGMTSGGGEIPKNQHFYYEIVEDTRSTPNPQRRRFRPSGAASLSRAGLSFRVNLQRQQEDRSRRGIPSSDPTVEVGE